MWHFSLYPEPALPPHAVALARSSLSTAAQDLSVALQQLAADTGVPGAPAISGLRGSRSNARCCWWYGDVLSLLCSGIDGLCFRAVVERDGAGTAVSATDGGATSGPAAEPAASIGMAAALSNMLSLDAAAAAIAAAGASAATTNGDLPRVPAASLLLLQSLHHDLDLLRSALCGQGVVPASCHLPALADILALCRLPPSKAASLRAALHSLIRDSEGASGEGNGDDDTSDEGEGGASARSCSLETRHAREVLLSGAGLPPASPLLLLRHLPAAARILAAPAAAADADESRSIDL